jgi:hypothetical protein
MKFKQQLQEAHLTITVLSLVVHYSVRTAILFYGRTTSSPTIMVTREEMFIFGTSRMLLLHLL